MNCFQVLRSRTQAGFAPDEARDVFVQFTGQGLTLLFAAPATGLSEDHNVVFRFLSWSLATLLLVTAAWPLNIPLAALAYRVRRGEVPLDLERDDLWWRSGFVALLECGLSLGTLLAVFVAVVGLGLPSGLVHLVTLLAYLPAGAWLAFWVFGLEDLLEGFGLFMLYVLLPGLPLLWIGKVTGLWTWLSGTAPWLLTPS